MSLDLIEIHFYFPKAKPKNKQGLVDLIMKSMRKDGTLQYAGYANEKNLQNDLLRRLCNYKADSYRGLPQKQKQLIKKSIHETIKKCNKILPLPTKNFIFVFPWFPSKNESVFNGSFGFAAYNCVLHIFVAPGLFTHESIANSIAHEINHTISFYYHLDRYGKLSLLDSIINEGLAENFREDVLENTKPAPWSVALTKKEAFSVLKTIMPLLNSKSYKIHREILFGNKKYKRWTGYSIGYWLVKTFKQKNKSLPWEEIIKMPAAKILQPVIEKEK